MYFSFSTNSFTRKPNLAKALSVAPIFCAFETTRNWFWAWQSSMMGYLLTAVLVFAAWAFVMEIMKNLIISLLLLGLTACDNNTFKEPARQKQIEALRKHSQAEIERYNHQKNEKFEEPDFSNLFKKKSKVN